MPTLKYAGHYTQNFDFSVGDVIKANNLPQVSVGMSYITNTGKGHRNYDDLLASYFDPDFEGDGRLYDSRCRFSGDVICRMFFNVHTYRVGTVIYDERTLFSYGSHYAMATVVFARQNLQLLDTVHFAYTERTWSRTTTSQLHDRVLPARYAASLEWRSKHGVAYTPSVSLPTEDDVLDMALTPVDHWPAVLSVFNKYQKNPHRKLSASEATCLSPERGSLERCDTPPETYPVCARCGYSTTNPDAAPATRHFVQIEGHDVCLGCVDVRGGDTP